MNLLKFYIDGKWVDPVKPDVIDVINPASEKSIGNVSVGSKADIDKAVKAARNAFQNFSKTLVSERVELLTEIRNIYKKRFDDIASAIQTEMGAPINLARGSQATVGLSHLKTAIRVLENHKFEFNHGNYLVRHEPIGVCGLITPWNWPINQVVSKLAPCLASGCTAVLKPSEIAPLSAMVIAEIFHEAGVPNGVFNLVNGLGPVVGEAMSSHDGIDMMSFTGSTRGGIAVAKASANTVKRVSQELGGKSPNIILDDVDLEKAVSMGIKQCFFNTGQSCSSPTRMLVPESMLDEATKHAVAAADAMSTGDPQNEEIFLGPISNKTQYEKVQTLIQEGIDEGAQLACGGMGRPDGLERGFFVKPTVFTNVHNKMKVAQEEIFGPVICLIPYKDLDEAIEIANDSPYGLSSMISCGDEAKGHEIAKRIRTGQVIVNRQSRGDFPAPFGGFKMSGNGREHGLFGIDEYLEVQAVIN